MPIYGHATKTVKNPQHLIIHSEIGPPVLKIYKNYYYWTNILRKFEETKQLHCEQKRTEVSFKIP
jgi:hypothetical protein